MLFGVIPFIEPRRLNIERSRKAFFALWILTLVFVAGIHVAIILSTLGFKVNMSMLVVMSIGLLFLLIGNYMSKIRSNFFMGIRTPWTLSSERSWTKTHRLSGRMFVFFGLLWLILPLFPYAELLFWIVLLSIFLGVGVLVVYSYVVWKNDPDKQAWGR